MSDLTLQERINAAILEQHAEEQRYRDRLAQIVLGEGSRENIGDIIRIGDTLAAVVEVRLFTSATEYTSSWAAVVDYRRPNEFFDSVEMALLHMIAMCHDGRTSRAHEYAARALKVPYGS